jgi:hypothetical protein
MSEAEVDRSLLRRVGLGLFVSLAIATLPFIEVLRGTRTAMYGDVNDIHVPLYVAAWRSMGNGNPPFWSNGTFAGQNLLGSGQSAMFYPVNVLFHWFEPITAYRWWLLLHVWIAVTGAFMWAWWRWRSVPGAIVAGFAYALNGFIVLHIVHMPFVASAAWVPFVFLGAELLVEKWTLPRVIACAAPIAAISVAGHGQILWLTAVGVSIMIACQLVRSGRGVWPWVRVGGAMAIGVCLGAVQLLPQYLFSRTSVRPELTMDGAFEHAAQPRHLLTLVTPHIMGGGADVPGMSGPWTGGDIYHEVANYLGITVVLLACLGVARHWRDRRVLGAVIVAVFALLASVGGSTPFGKLVFSVVPMAGSFRGWARDLLLLNVVVACLAALGVREASSLSRHVLSRSVIAVSVAALVLRLIPILTDLGGAVAAGGAVSAVGIPIVLLLAALGAVALATWRPRVGAVALVVVCAVDMVTFTVASPWRTSGLSTESLESFYSDSPPGFGDPSDAAGGVDRWVSDSYVFRMVSLVKGIQGVNGYDTLLQAEFASTAGGFVYDGYPLRGDFWEPGWLSDILRVTTLVASPSVVPTADGWQRDRVVEGTDFVRWTRQPRLDEAYIVGAAEVASLDEIRDRMRASDADLTKFAWVEDGSVAEGLENPGIVGTAEGSMDGSGRGTYSVDASSDGLLVVSYGWLDGWNATVDGADAQVVRANGLVLGVTVSSGRHEVRLWFEPPGLRLGYVIAALGLTAAIIPSVVRVWRRRRSVPSDDPIDA